MELKYFGSLKSRHLSVPDAPTVKYQTQKVQMKRCDTGLISLLSKFAMV